MRRPNEAANVILTRPVKGSTLKGWGMRLAARAGMRKAKVARARKLAVVLHRMLANGTSFLFDKTATAVARSAKEKETQVRAVQIGRSEQVPSPGRWTRSDR